MTNSRAKGAAFERQIAKELFDLTGITFKRDLEQYRASDRGDLIADDPDWPFLIECKALKSGGFQQAWWAQAATAANAAARRPVVVWKINNKPILCRVTIATVFECLADEPCSSGRDHHADISLEGLAYLAREAMA